MSINETERKARELRELQALIDEATAEAEVLRDALKAAMGDAEEVCAGVYKITWKAVTSTRIDTGALRKALPDAAAASPVKAPCAASAWRRMYCERTVVNPADAPLYLLICRQVKELSDILSLCKLVSDMFRNRFPVSPPLDRRGQTHFPESFGSGSRVRGD